jgi:plasmid stabilization system protein ParE
MHIRTNAAAEKAVQKIEKTAENLTSFATGRAGRIFGTYEKLIPGLPHILAYRLEDRPSEQLVVILHVIHTARNWQPGSRPSDLS